MTIYVAPGQRKPSYSVPTDPGRDDFEPDLYNVNWVISMPSGRKPTSPHDSLDEREDFLTVRAIVATPSQRVCSRATVVWEVVKLKELETKAQEDVQV